MVMEQIHFAASGSVEKLPRGPITGPRPGPTLARQRLVGNEAGRERTYQDTSHEVTDQRR